MKKIFSLVLVLFMAIAFSGCENFFDFKPTGTIEGYVTDTRGGPGLEGATIKYLGESVKTDEDGYFNIEAWADREFQMIIRKEGRGSSRVQNVMVEEGETLFLEIPNREAFNPNWPKTTPKIDVSGVERGEVVSGDLEIDFEIEGDRPTYVFYVNFGGLQRGPREAFDIDVDEGSAVIDTTKHPNGDNFIRILAYDDNENAVMKFIPVVVDNEVGDGDPPGDLAWLDLYSISMGKNFGYFSEQVEVLVDEYGKDLDPDYYETPEGHRIDLSQIPDDSTLYIEVMWSPVPEADGYTVYRSFDGESFEDIGNITQYTDVSDDGQDPILVGMYNDFSPQLGIKETYYKVVPYNAFGEGDALERAITPLAPYNVVLETPEHEATDVDLMPTFTWDLDIKGEFDEDRDIIELHIITLFDATDWLVIDDLVQDQREYPLGFELNPNTVYSWDIVVSQAFHTEVEAEGASQAISIAGDGAGSLIGEFMFTTETE